MTKDRAVEQALEWLNAQLEALRYFRNATSRDAGFKQWRQNTLTIIQRIWPEEPMRSNRFRQIPFAPKSVNADDKTARDSYAKGVAEVTGLLKMFILDIQHNGLAPAETAAAASAPEFETLEDEEPEIEAPAPVKAKAPAAKPKAARSGGAAPAARTGATGTSAPATRPGATSSPAPAVGTGAQGTAAKPRTGAPGTAAPTPRPGASVPAAPAGASGAPAPGRAAAPSAAGPAAGASGSGAATPAARAGGSGAAAPAPSRGASGRGGGALQRLRQVRGQKRLKEMLGLTALSHSAPPSEADAAAAAAEAMAAEPELKIERVGRQTTRAGGPRSPVKTAGPLDGLAESIAKAIEEAPGTGASGPANVVPHQAPPRKVETDPWLELGAKLAALCGQLGPLGVPVPDHGLVRGTVLDLARHAQDRSLDGLMVRKAMPVLSLYPNLCRRALAILTPVLDSVA